MSSRWSSLARRWCSCTARSTACGSSRGADAGRAGARPDAAAVDRPRDMSTLGAALAATAARRGAVTALLFDGVEYSYRVIADRAAAVAGALRQRGVRPGDRVAVG